MKNPENKNGLNANQPALSISATLCEPDLIRKLVERLAFRNPGKDIPGTSKTRMAIFRFIFH